MGSRPSFRIQSHAVLLMIIRSAGNRFTADSPTTGRLELSPPDCHEAESICQPPGGKERFKFAQQAINAVLTQCCHAGKKETLEEFWVFAPAVALPGSWVRIDRPLWSIRADRVRSYRNEGKREPRLAAREDRLGGRWRRRERR